MEKIKYYSKEEERINVISHGVGFVLAVVGLILLSIRSSLNGNIWHIVSFIVFGVALVLLYAASTFYHNAKKDAIRRKLKIIDHCAIFVLIAGTYTPLTVIVLDSAIGMLYFSIAWSLAIIGIILKLFFTGRFKIISTMAYLLMSWIIIFAIKPLSENLSSEGLFWLFAGGVFYTTGAVLYSIKKIKFNHAMFHILALMGSFSHFMLVYAFVL